MSDKKSVQNRWLADAVSTPETLARYREVLTMDERFDNALNDGKLFGFAKSLKVEGMSQKDMYVFFLKHFDGNSEDKFYQDDMVGIMDSILGHLAPGCNLFDTHLDLNDLDEDSHNR